MTCEDFPCCGHEWGDCEGQKYGSDESIKNDPHLLCDHENGECGLAEYDDDFDPESETHDYGDHFDPDREALGDPDWQYDRLRDYEMGF